MESWPRTPLIAGAAATTPFSARSFPVRAGPVGPGPVMATVARDDFRLPSSARIAREISWALEVP